MFGIPGGGSSLDLIEAAGALGLDFILVRSETAGALMAAVSGELTGVPGVMLAGVGPGAASAANGVAYASLERAPMVLLTDGPAQSLHQAFDHRALLRPVAKHQARLTPDHADAVMETLLDITQALPRGPVHIDLTATDAATPITTNGPAAIDASAADPLPAQVRDGDIDAARALLAASRKPLIIAGMEARYDGAAPALDAFARQLGAPVLLTYKAKGCLADDDARLLEHLQVLGDRGLG